MTPGMSKDASNGLSDALDSFSGRALIAHMAREGWFMDVVPGVDCLVAQGIAVDLMQECMYLSAGNTMKLIREQFVEGEVKHVSRSNSRTDSGSNAGINAGINSE